MTVHHWLTATPYPWALLAVALAAAVVDAAWSRTDRLRAERDRRIAERRARRVRQALDRRRG